MSAGLDVLAPRASASANGQRGSASASTAESGHARERAWRAVLSFRDERERRIGQARTFTLETPVTLSSLGREFGITRERVRQVENELRARVQQNLESEAAAASLLELAADVGRDLGTIACEESVRRVLGEACPDGIDASMRRAMLLTLAGPYTLADGFWQRGDALAELRAGVSARAGAPFSERELRRLLKVAGVSADQHDGCIAALPVTLSDGRVTPPDNSLGERAVRALDLNGEPMSTAELSAALSADVSTEGVLSRLRSDHRIRRVGLHTYGLTEWDEDTFSTIADELQAAIEARGGRASMADLAAALSDELGVAPCSVRAPAATPRFARMHDGTVTVRDACGAELQDAPCPGLDRDLVRCGAAWALRVSVEQQVLRGSARPLRIAIPRAAGVAPGEARTIMLRNGSVQITWRCKRPAITSTRLLVRDLGCAGGERVFVPLADGAEAFAVGAHEIGVAAGVARVALELGQPADAALSRIAPAIGLSPGAGAPDVMARLQARGQHELADLVAARHSDRGETAGDAPPRPGAGRRINSAPAFIAAGTKRIGAST